MTLSGNKIEIANIGFKKIAKKEKALWVSDQFDKVARRYDFMNTLLSFGIHYIWKKIAVSMLCPEPGNIVLDLCGGTGDLAVSILKKTGEKGRVVLYDINYEMMKAGKSKKTHHKLRKKILFVQGDGEKMALKNNVFDGAIVGFGMRNLTDINAGFKEMHRVLKPGGTMICLEFSRPENAFFRKIYDLYSFYIMPFLGEIFTGSKEAYTYLPESIRFFPGPDELVEKLRTAGFKQVEYRKLTNGIAIIHKGLKG